MPDPLILYSTVTKLAYNIAERYYRKEHYVWCAPRRHVDRFAWPNPPSSDPVNIYWRLTRDIKGGDQHSATVKQNRLGLIRGATVKEQAGIIDGTTRTLITAIAKKATLAEFQPMLLVMPFEVVRNITKSAALGSRAGVTSEEFIIESLPRDCFDVLELEER